MYWESILRDMIGYRVKLKSFSPVSYQPVPLFGMNNVINFLECFLNIKKMYFLPLVAQMVKTLPAMQKIQVRSLGREDYLD